MAPTKCRASVPDLRLRRQEGRTRVEVVALARWMGILRVPRLRVAQRIGLSPATLGRWDRAWPKDRLRARPLGRPRRLAEPLVLKSDNGGPFISDPVRKLLERFQVVHLLSPLYLPRYNGAVEAGNGSLKTRAYHEAARHGRIGNWTSDDVEAARILANLTARPWGPYGPTPQRRWDQRVPISAQQRQAFRQCVQDMQDQVAAECRLLPDELRDRSKRATVARLAVRRALEKLGYLVVRRRRITPPVKSDLRANIT